MINMLFLKIAEMSLTAGIVILVVIMVRLAIRGLPKSFGYALWLVVAFRLVVPVAADSDISVFNMFTVGNGNSENGGIVGGEAVGMEDVMNGPDIDDGNVAGHISGQVIQGGVQKDTIDVESSTEAVRSSNRNNDAASCFDLVSIMAFIWIGGILIFVTYTVIAHVQIRRKIQYSIRLRGNVYECDNIRSPFVTGIVSPRICLPFRLSETEQQCILAHERYHIRRKDYLIKRFAYLLVIIYWFQPLVWVAYRLMCIDMEMSCDEKVVSGFTVDMRKEYSRLLLAFAANNRQFPASPLAFGEENTMKRIKNILNYKKTARWKLTGGVAVLILTMAACATDASTDAAIAPVPDLALEMNNNAEKREADTAADSDIIVNMANDMDVIVHHSERHDMDSHDQEEQMHHSMEHHQAQWAENSMFDMEFYSLDYADSDRIVFHISSGLFEYDLKSQKLTHSIDLKALNCQEVQTGGECEVAVYQDGDHRLRAVIRPYPYSDEDSYVYDIESDELFAYDASLLDDHVLFDGFASKYDPAVSEAMRTWRAAENVLPLGGNAYGALYWGPGPDLANLCYEAGDQKWQIFHKEQATLPRLLKQDDNFYQSFSLHSGKEISQCAMDYQGFYNIHDYAGLCALSTGLVYSDAMQQEFSERLDQMFYFEEISHSEDEKEYLFEVTYTDGSGEKEQKGYLNFIYLDGEGWRAEGLPTAQSGSDTDQE